MQLATQICRWSIDTRDVDNNPFSWGAATLLMLLRLMCKECGWSNKQWAPERPSLNDGGPAMVSGNSSKLILVLVAASVASLLIFVCYKRACLSDGVKTDINWLVAASFEGMVVLKLLWWQSQDQSNFIVVIEFMPTLILLGASQIKMLVCE